MQYINGGVRTLANYGAHAATNATTQMLVVLRDNPKVRLLFTLAEGIIGSSPSARPASPRLADLKGKRVVVPRNTSAHYYLVAMLRSVGLEESDVTLVTAPAEAMAAALVRGDADAISMWEPESENARRARWAATPWCFRTTRSTASSSASIRQPTCWQIRAGAPSCRLRPRAARRDVAGPA